MPSLPATPLPFSDNIARWNQPYVCDDGKGGWKLVSRRMLCETSPCRIKRRQGNGFIGSLEMGGDGGVSQICMTATMFPAKQTRSVETTIDTR